MRITGGQMRGRRLASPRGFNIRPTSDKIREAIFNLIGQTHSGDHVLDLYGGTGSLGLEALSRGASMAVFVDDADEAARLIRKNLMLCGCQDRGTVLKEDLRRGLPRKYAVMSQKFELVFIDPPYGKDLIPPMLEELVQRDLLASGSLTIAESSKSESMSAAPERLRLVDERVYGRTRIRIFHQGDLL
jgi:16S rRNA (guanine966-N2)-methyltransferase